MEKAALTSAASVDIIKAGRLKYLQALASRQGTKGSPVRLYRRACLLLLLEMLSDANAKGESSHEQPKDGEHDGEYFKWTHSRHPLSALVMPKGSKCL